jgi:hypothetical protein
MNPAFFVHNNFTQRKYNMPCDNFNLRLNKRHSLRKQLSSGLLGRVVWLKFTDVSEVLAASIIRVMSDDGSRKNL